MSSHFLLSAQARTLSLKAIYKGGEDVAYMTFRRLRWPETDGEPVCPKCGCLDHYNIATRRRFKCAGCGTQFSVTSGTIFASRKLSFMDLCAGISIFVNAVKGLSALQLGRDLDVSYKTAFVLAHKLREALSAENKDATLAGEVEIDGAYFGGTVRPENRKEDRKDRRRKEHQSTERRVVIVMRERLGRTLTFVTKREAEGVKLAVAHVAKGTKVYADEANHWDDLHATFPDAGRINHSEAYSADGANTNQAESYFARLRRMVTGQHHFVTARYLHQYATEAAWKEDNRRLDNGQAFSSVVRLALSSAKSASFCGYWQRRRVAKGA
ncbi:IS1595 family transposase [Methylobacterium sp. J-026]|uniref:IS1595 family transposase n=1 Tax=Methylobacterium sp. J-026 TaxID=2836624 RepID=UPI001FB8E77E|nr:IS1595 family transposase [Methylobacterium sp. J-026]MCJ2133019.1 IS1595 family transposase [Methylobacterium sp. J-026]